MSNRAVLVGIEESMLPRSDLPGAACNVVSQRNLLEQHFGFTEPGSIVSLVKKQDTTYANILATIRNELVQGARCGDVRVFALSAHGGTILAADQSTNDLFLTSDWSRYNPAGLLESELEDVFLGLPDGVRLFCVYDCCRPVLSVEQQRKILEWATKRQRTGTLFRNRKDNVHSQEWEKLFPLRLIFERRPVPAIPAVRPWVELKACTQGQSASYPDESYGRFTSALNFVLTNTPTHSVATAMEAVCKGWFGGVDPLQKPNFTGPADLVNGRPFA